MDSKSQYPKAGCEFVGDVDMGIWMQRKGYLLMDSTNPCADQML